jgi:hypothetical protein
MLNRFLDGRVKIEFEMTPEELLGIQRKNTGILLIEC